MKIISLRLRILKRYIKKYRYFRELENRKKKSINRYGAWRTTHILNIFKSMNFEKYKVLDIGCSTGSYTKKLGKNADFVIGIDFNKDNIKIAEENTDPSATNVTYFVCDAENLSFKNNTFDVVVCMEVLEHLVNDEKCCKEIYRILKPKGIAFISVPIQDKTSITEQFMKFFPKRFRSIASISELFSTIKEHLRGYSIKSLMKLLSKQHFKILNIYSFSFVFPFYVKIANVFPKILKIYEFVGKRFPMLSESPIFKISKAGL